MSSTGQPPFGAAPDPAAGSGDADSASGRPAAPTPWMPPNAGTTPNAERYLLEADALRRRQLHAALLHGSSRTWRDRRRIWPAMIAGVVVVAVIVAVFLVVHALQAEQERQEQEEQQQGAVATVLTTQSATRGRTTL